MSELTRGEYTQKHVDALIILDGLKVSYTSETVIRCYGKFDSNSRPIFYKVDILVDDPRFGSGVIEMDGDSHDTHKKRIRDLARASRLAVLGLWFERVRNSEVGWDSVEALLKRHIREVDDYGGPMP